MNTNIITTNIQSEVDHKMVDRMIDEVTNTVTKMVPGIEDYDVMTACFIDGEFVFVTGYDLDNNWYEAAMEAAKVAKLEGM